MNRAANTEVISEKRVKSTRENAQQQLIRGTLIGSLSKDMLVGDFFVAFAIQVLLFSNEQVSWFLALLPLAVLLRYPFLDKIRKVPRVRITLMARSIQLFCVGMLIALPTNAISIPVLFGVALLFVFGNEFLQNAVWTSLLTEFTLERTRGKFIGQLRTWKTASALAFALFAFFFVGEELDRFEHRILLCIVFALLAYSFLCFTKVPQIRPPKSVLNHSGRGKLLETIKTSELLRLPLAMTFVQSVMSWPILIVFLVGNLNLPANLLALYLAVAMAGPIATSYLWGLIADRFGIRPIYFINFAGTALIFPLLLFVPDFKLVDAGSLQWYLGIAALFTFQFAISSLFAAQMMANSILHSRYVSKDSGFHAFNLLTAGMQLFKAGLVALGAILLSTLNDTTAIAAKAPSTKLLWIDPFRLSTIGIIVVCSLVGIMLSTKIRRRNQGMSQ